MLAMVCAGSDERTRQLGHQSFISRRTTTWRSRHRYFSWYLDHRYPAQGYTDLDLDLDLRQDCIITVHVPVTAPDKTLVEWLAGLVTFAGVDQSARRPRPQCRPRHSVGCSPLSSYAKIAKRAPSFHGSNVYTKFRRSVLVPQKIEPITGSSWPWAKSLTRPVVFWGNIYIVTLTFDLDLETGLNDLSYTARMTGLVVALL